MPEAKYPEHEKLKAVADKSQAIGEFLDAYRGRLCAWREATAFDPEGYYPDRRTIEQILADHFKIDLNEIETEKRAMIDRIRQMNDA